MIHPLYVMKMSLHMHQPCPTTDGTTTSDGNHGREGGRTHMIINA